MPIPSTIFTGFIEMQLINPRIANIRQHAHKYSGIPFKQSTENWAMKLLLQICCDYLKAYPTTYQNDCEQLQNGNLQPFSNERHALIQVKGEKEVLLFYKDFANVAIQLLQVQDADHFDSLLESVRVLKDPILYQYCRGTIGRLLHDDMRRQLEHKKKDMDLTRPTIV